MLAKPAGTDPADDHPAEDALLCYPMPPDAWPADGEVVERVPLRSCVRRGAAIEVVTDRARENRSQLVFSRAQGRDVVFWQSPRTRKQARPNVALPTARAGGLADLEIIVDTRERSAYRFPGQAVSTVSRALPCGDYGVVADGRLVASGGTQVRPRPRQQRGQREAALRVG